MALSNFTDKTITITEEVRTTVWWESSIVENVIYNNIPCAYFFERQVQEPTQSVREVQQWRVSVMIDPGSINTRMWMKAVITDPSLWTIITWIIENINLRRRVDWTPDNIQFNLKNI